MSGVGHDTIICHVKSTKTLIVSLVGETTVMVEQLNLTRSYSHITYCCADFLSV